MFLNTCKALDNLLDEDIIFKLKQNRILVKLMNILKVFGTAENKVPFLQDRYHTASNWVNFQTGVPKGSILSVQDLPTWDAQVFLVADNQCQLT